MVTGSDRFKVVTHPFLPGICRSCGVPYGKRTLIDIGLDADFCNRQHVEGDIDINTAGAVYFCESCVINMAELVNCIAPVRGMALQQELAQVMDDNAKLKQRILGLDGIVNGYRALGIDSSAITGSNVPELPFIPAESTGESESNGSGVSEEPGDFFAVGNSEIDEFMGERRGAERISWDNGERLGSPEFTDII